VRSDRHPGEGSSGTPEAFRRRFSELLETFQQQLILVDASARGIVIIVIEITEKGTPRVTVHSADETVDNRRKLDSLALPGRFDALFIVSTRLGGPDRVFQELCKGHPDAESAELPGINAEALVRELIDDLPLRLRYEMVVLRTDPASGRLKLRSRPLFSKGARRGNVTEPELLCAGTSGMVLAITVWAEKPLGLLSLHRALVPPGRHRMRFVLEGPGRVGFAGPAQIVLEERPWSELRHTVPEQYVPTAENVHLICGVEVCCTEPELDERRDRIKELIKRVSTLHPEQNRLSVSVVAYAGHDHSYGRVDHSTPKVLVWAGSAAQAEQAVETLEPAPVPQAFGAQVEDLLAKVDERLHGSGSAAVTALVIAGNSPPHPPTTDPRTDLLRCPNKYSWEAKVRDLRDAGVRIGAICGDLSAARPPAVWRRLAPDGLLTLRGWDADDLAERLGLTRPTGQGLLFPLDEGEL
jgi:hypothetical protein